MNAALPAAQSGLSYPGPPGHRAGTELSLPTLAVNFSEAGLEPPSSFIMIFLVTSDSREL